MMVSPTKLRHQPSFLLNLLTLQNFVYASAILILGLCLAMVFLLLSQQNRHFGGVIWYYNSLRSLPARYQSESTSAGVYVVSPLLFNHLGDDNEHLQPNDILLAVEGKAPEQLWAIFREKSIGETIALEISRKEELLRVSVQIATFDGYQLVRSYVPLILAVLSTLFAAVKILAIELRYSSSLSLLLLIISFLILGFMLHFSGITAPPFWDHRMWIVVNTLALLAAAAMLLQFTARLVGRAGVFRMPIKYATGVGLFLFGFLGAMFWAIRTSNADLAKQLYGCALAILVVSFLLSIFEMLAFRVSSGVYVRGLHIYGAQIERQNAESVRNILVLWAFTVLCVICFWAGPYLLWGQLLLPFDSWTIFAAMNAFGLYYVAHNDASSAKLVHEVTLRMDHLHQLQLMQDEQMHNLRQLEEAIHDRVLANLKGAQMVVVSVQRRLAQEGIEHHAAQLREVATALQKIGQETRSILEGVHPTILTKAGFYEAFSILISHFRSKNPSLQVNVKLSHCADPEPLIVQERLYIILRCALNNIHEHAHAKNVMINLSNRGNQITLQIADDGVGFDLSSPFHNDNEGRSHIGLRSMRLNAAEIGAAFQLWSAPGEGTEIKVTFAQTKP